MFAGQAAAHRSPGAHHGPGRLALVLHWGCRPVPLQRPGGARTAAPPRLVRARGPMSCGDRTAPWHAGSRDQGAQRRGLWAGDGKVSGARLGKGFRDGAAQHAGRNGGRAPHDSESPRARRPMRALRWRQCHCRRRWHSSRAADVRPHPGCVSR